MKVYSTKKNEESCSGGKLLIKHQVLVNVDDLHHYQPNLFQDQN